MALLLDRDISSPGPGGLNDQAKSRGPVRDELDDLLDHDAEINDAWRAVDTDMTVRPAKNQTGIDGGNHFNNTIGQTLGIDEEIKVKKRRAPAPKLDETRLLSAQGIPKLRRITKERLKFRGKGHEFSDMQRMLDLYQLWLDDLYPRAKFADGLAMLEKLGHSKRMQVMRKAWIDEGKPRPGGETTEDVDHARETRSGDGESGGVRRQLQQSSGEQSAEAQRARRTRTQEPTANGDSELYSVTPDPARAKSLDLEAGAGGTGGIANDGDDQPEEDELDALLAEDAARMEKQQQGNSTDPSLTAQLVGRRPGEDDFADEMEAMVGMNDTW